MVDRHCGIGHSRYSEKRGARLRRLFSQHQKERKNPGCEFVGFGGIWWQKGSAIRTVLTPLVQVVMLGAAILANPLHVTYGTGRDFTALSHARAGFMAPVPVGIVA